MEKFAYARTGPNACILWVYKPQQIFGGVSRVLNDFSHQTKQHRLVDDLVGKFVKEKLLQVYLGRYFIESLP